MLYWCYVGNQKWQKMSTVTGELIGRAKEIVRDSIRDK